jgi:type II secretory pathway pseudopilin PulG
MTIAIVAAVILAAAALGWLFWTTRADARRRRAAQRVLTEQDALDGVRPLSHAVHLVRHDDDEAA